MFSSILVTNQPHRLQVSASNPTVVTEDQIMRNLFAQRFDNVIIQLLTCNQQVGTDACPLPHGLIVSQTVLGGRGGGAYTAD